MDGRSFTVVLAAIVAVWFVPAIIAFWQHRNDPAGDPADEPCSDYSESNRPVVTRDF